MDSAYIGSYIPSSLDSDAPVYVSDIATYAQRNVPSAYPEDVSSYKKEHPSRNQNPYGTCWAFSSIGLEEFDLIAKGQRDSSVDLSELQLIHLHLTQLLIRSVEPKGIILSIIIIIPACHIWKGW